MSRPLLTLLLAIAIPLSITVAPASGDDHKDSFRRGKQAWDKGRWQDVVRYMAEAIQQQPQAGETIRLYGHRYEDYLPHFYLGLAFEKQGNCSEALTALEESARQGELDPTQQNQLEEVQTACRQQLPEAPSNAQVQQIKSPAELGGITAPGVQPSSVEKTDEAKPVADARPVEPEKEPEKEVSRPPPILRRAAAAMLTGDYRQTLAELQDVELSESKAQATAHLLRAAACYALYLEGGSNDEQLLTRADEHARFWRKLDAGVTLPSFAFSPALLRLLQGSNP